MKTGNKNWDLHPNQSLVLAVGAALQRGLRERLVVDRLVALLMAYVTGLNLAAPEMGAYDQPQWVRWVEFGAIGLAGLFGLLRRTRLTTLEGTTRTVPGLSRFNRLEYLHHGM